MPKNENKLIRINKITKFDKRDVERVVSIHLETFQGFFLTFMGKGFLRQLYQSYCEHERSGVLGAWDEKNRLIGFLAYSTDLSGLYRFMIKRRLIPFAWYAFEAFLRKPRVFVRLVRAFLKPGESERCETYVKLASLGVHPEAQSCGVGSQLIDHLKQNVDFRNYAYISLETDATDNEFVNRFYQKNGFVLIRSFSTHEGRLMNEYQYHQS